MSKKRIIGILGFFLTLLSFNAHAINGFQDDVWSLQSFETAKDIDIRLFEAPDAVLHFVSMRILHLPDGSIFICPHEAVVSSTILGTACQTEDMKNAWTPVLSLKIKYFEIVGVRFTISKQKEVELSIFFKRTIPKE